MPVMTGLDRLIASGAARLKGKRVGVVCNQATVASDLRHLLDHLLELGVEIGAAFGPQHGIWGHTQDNMIEWEGYIDPRTGLRFFSLYGEHREPTPAMLEGLDLLVVDLPDIGSRYYTFMWTMALCLKACEPLGIPVLILDRPNPLGGVQVEGTVLRGEHTAGPQGSGEAFSSFVGLYPLPTRHGMTLGEIATYLQTHYFPKSTLDVERVSDWDRSQFFDDTGLPWVMPSPNMPTSTTALVYPGGCLVEATVFSEGRGTTRPFETFGAPWIDAWRLADDLNAEGLPGVYFRPIQFQPTFHKHGGQICGGVFIHILDRAAFRPVITTVTMLAHAVRQSGDRPIWIDPPYEYVWDRLPIDILAGNDWLRPAIERGKPWRETAGRMETECREFDSLRTNGLLYYK